MKGRRAHHRPGLRTVAGGARDAGDAGRRLDRERLSNAGSGSRPRDGRPQVAGAGIALRPAATDARQLIATLRHRGVAVKTLTGDAVSTATEVAKGAASVVLTEPGLVNIVALVEQGRAIYQRILTWIINKISRTILKAAFVSMAYVVTGKFVISALAMLSLTFLTDFAEITLATDHVRPSRKPETWNIGGFVTVSVVLGLAMVGQALVILRLAWGRFGLVANEGALYTFSFLLLLYFAVSRGHHDQACRNGSMIRPVDRLEAATPRSPKPRFPVRSAPPRAPRPAPLPCRGRCGGPGARTSPGPGTATGGWKTRGHPPRPAPGAGWPRSRAPGRRPWG